MRLGEILRDVDGTRWIAIMRAWSGDLLLAKIPEGEDAQTMGTTWDQLKVDHRVLPAIQAKTNGKPV